MTNNFRKGLSTGQYSRRGKAANGGDRDTSKRQKKKKRGDEIRLGVYLQKKRKRRTRGERRLGKRKRRFWVNSTPSVRK